MTARADSTRLVATVALCTLAATFANASTEKLLYSFPAGAYVVGRPDQDSKGALYGTAETLDGYGAIFQLKQKNGIWKYKTLFDFGGNLGDYPYAGPLIDRTTGILYGTTLAGGNSGGGTVYSLAPLGRGWSETVLHSFSSSDGFTPFGMLLKDKTTGSLYGTTNGGGTNCGTAFELSQSNGNWAFSTIYNFQGGSDACQPYTQLKPGAKAGTLIGATFAEQIFQLKQTHGAWSDSVVYTFTGGSDGKDPSDLDGSGDGTIYGVANKGGQYGFGVVFKLTPDPKDKYTFSVIYNFRNGSDGAYPAGINLDSATGNLYGTTQHGGTGNGGTVFRLAASGNSWTETVLHSFAGGTRDGAYPNSRPIVDRTTGALYGTTTNGGANGGGTVYMVQP